MTVSSKEESPWSVADGGIDIDLYADSIDSVQTKGILIFDNSPNR
jgi:hypothetical protein